MADLTCPFCNEDDFDDIGLCLHLSANCSAYDNACRRTSDEIDRRTESAIAARLKKNEPPVG